MVIPNAPKDRPPVILHVGLPKTATTVLQRHVLRHLAADLGLDYVGSRNLKAFLDARDKGMDLPPPPPARGELISSEFLIDWNPSRWEENVRAMLSHFGSDATVLLVIRRPSQWLRSIYQQLCQHEGEWLYPDEFFFASVPWDASVLRPRFDVANFDIPHLVDLCTRSFSRVVVQKYETLSDGRLLNELGSSGASVALFVEEMSRRRSNQAYSRSAARLGFALAHLRERLGGGPRRLPEDMPFQRSRLERLFRKAMQLGLDRLLPYRPYEIDWSDLPYLPIERHEQEYDALADFAVYREGQSVEQSARS